MPAEIFICYIPTFFHVSEGKFKSFGLSNYAAWEVVRNLFSCNVYVSLNKMVMM